MYNLTSGSVQGRSDGGYMGIHNPPKSVQVNFLWGKNDVRTAIEQFYTPQKTFIPPKQISGYAPGSVKERKCCYTDRALLQCFISWL